MICTRIPSARRLRLAAFALAGILMASSAAPQSRHIYDEHANARAEIRAAILKAGREHKRVLLDFGGDWCGDCQVLDIYFHREPNADLLARNFILVDIDVGRLDKNVDVAQKYGVPISRGVPALAVLDEHGHLLYSQSNAEFTRMHAMSPDAVTDFLRRWKASLY